MLASRFRGLSPLVLLMANIILGTLPGDCAAGELLSATGIIKAMDLSANKVTIHNSDGNSMTVSINAGSAISRNSKKAKLKALVLGDEVTVQYDGSTLNAASLAASGPVVERVSGKVNAVNKGHGTILLGAKRLISVNAGTRISRGGKAVSLSSLTRKDRFVAQLNPGTNLVVSFIGDGPETAEVEGTISAIEGNSVTITPENGASDVALIVDESVMIEIDGEPATLADLYVGQGVEAYYDPATLIAFSIEAEADDEEFEKDDAQLQGTIAQVDLVNFTLTVTPAGGGVDITLRVSACTEIEVNGEEATLAEVQVGMPVEVEYDADTLLVEEIEA